MQVCVLMETVETLQSGRGGELEQRLVTLTAQLASAKAREVALEARCGQLLEEAESATKAAGAAVSEAQATKAKLSESSVALAAAEAAARAAEAALADARGEARARTEDATRCAREVDEVRARLAVVDADGEGLRATLRDMSARHVELLNR